MHLKQLVLGFTLVPLLLVVSMLGIVSAAGVDTAKVNGQLFRPTEDGGDFIGTYDSDILGKWWITTGMFLNYARDAVILNRPRTGTKVRSLLEDVVTGDLMLALGVWDDLQIQVGAPVHFWSDGSSSLKDVNVSGASLGDLSIGTKWRVLNHEEHFVGLALLPRLTLPTGNADRFLGEENATGGIAIILDKVVSIGTNDEPLHLSANAGFIFRPEIQTPEATLDDFISYGLAANYPIPWEMMVIGELQGNAVAKSMFSSFAGNPLELDLAVRKPLPHDVDVTLGAGTGLSRGIGAPRVRVFAGFVYETRPEPDSDGDGLVDKKDACPAEAEDKDGFEDGDGCPEDQVRFAGEVVDSLTGEPVTEAIIHIEAPLNIDITRQSGSFGHIWVGRGLYYVSVTAAGYVDVMNRYDLESTATVETVIRMEPQPRLSGFSIAISDAERGQSMAVDISSTTASDLQLLLSESSGTEYSAMITQAKHLDLRFSANGYHQSAITSDLVPGQYLNLNVAMQRRKVKVIAKQLVLDPIFFASGKATLLAKSFPVLDSVDEFLQGNKKVILEIHGHTDSQGADKANLILSRNRAGAVALYLGKLDPEYTRGGKNTRVRFYGHGETMPIADNATEEGRARNRRVEFLVSGEMTGEMIEVRSATETTVDSLALETTASTPTTRGTAAAVSAPIDGAQEAAPVTDSTTQPHGEIPGETLGEPTIESPTAAPVLPVPAQPFSPPPIVIPGLDGTPEALEPPPLVEPVSRDAPPPSVVPDSGADGVPDSGRVDSEPIGPAE